MEVLPDLSLPATVPEMATYHDREAYDGPFAIYTLCNNIAEEEITSIIKACESECEIEGLFVRPPHCRFPERRRRLRDVVEYHVRLAREGNFDPTYFMVVVSPKWRVKGVVVVALDDEELQCRPDLVWMKAEDAGTAMVNLQIANVGWEAVKEGALELDDDDDDGDDAGGGDGEGVVNQDNEDDLGKAPGTGFHIGVYIRDNLDTSALLREIVCKADIKRDEEIVCKALKAVPEDEGSQRDLLSRASTAHPVEVSRHPTLHKRMFLVADNLDYANAGLTLVDLDWDRETSGKTDDELREIGKTANTDSIAVGTHAAAAGDWAAVFIFATIARKGGLAKWRPKHVLVAAYSVPYPDCDIKVAEAMDPRWSKRGRHQDRVLFGGAIEGRDELDTTQLYRELLQAHSRFCRRLGFAVNLCRGYFVYCDTREPEEDDEVIVIRLVNSNEAVSDVEKRYVSGLEGGQVETFSCRAAEAHALITDIVKGKKKWRGVTVDSGT